MLNDRYFDNVPCVSVTYKHVGCGYDTDANVVDCVDPFLNFVDADVKSRWDDITLVKSTDQIDNDFAYDSNIDIDYVHDCDYDLDLDSDSYSDYAFDLDYCYDWNVDSDNDYSNDSNFDYGYDHDYDLHGTVPMIPK